MREKLTSMASALLFGLLTAACSGNSVQDAVDIVNSQCPIALGEAGKITNVVMLNDTITYVYSIAEELYSIEALRETPNSSKPDLKLLLANADESTRELLRRAIATKTPLKFLFVGMETSQKAQTVLTMADLEECYKNYSLSPLERLINELNNINKNMPVDVSDDMVIDRVALEDNNVVYVYRIYNEVADLESFKSNMEQTSEDLRHTIHDQAEEDPAFRVSMAMIVAAGKNLVYRYSVGKDDDRTKHVDLVVPLNELRSLIHLD